MNSTGRELFIAVAMHRVQCSCGRLESGGALQIPLERIALGGFCDQTCPLPVGAQMRLVSKDGTATWTRSTVELRFRVHVAVITL